MEHLNKAFGEYQTNCFILKTSGGDFIIDPGFDSLSWVSENITNPAAILLTHGHFDHIFEVASLQEFFKKNNKNVPIYCPQKDHFMLLSDCFNTGITPCSADILVPCEKGETNYEINGVRFSFLHYPGHTPGCSIIKFTDRIYSGDFIFRRSIGRFDFPYSSRDDMKESLERFIKLEIDDMDIYPGHGEKTNVNYEKENLKLWIERI